MRYQEVYDKQVYEKVKQSGCRLEAAHGERISCPTCLGLGTSSTTNKTTNVCLHCGGTGEIDPKDNCDKYR